LIAALGNNEELGEAVMKARRVIESASNFEAATLKVLCKSFDDAW
jgi:hypothetical protein